MERIQKIIGHAKWKQSMECIRRAEITRRFCCHGTEHLMDVARLSYIEVLERGLPIPKELLYAAALLHDIGRGAEYETGIPHEQAGPEIAEKILKDCEFPPGECEEILNAIRGHRQRETGLRRDLAGVLYRADKASRMCWDCAARRDCNWPEERKNKIITV